MYETVHLAVGSHSSYKFIFLHIVKLSFSTMGF